MVDENGKLKQTTTSTQQQAQQATLTQEEIQGQAELTQAEIAAYNTIRQYEEQVHGFVMGMLKVMKGAFMEKKLISAMRHSTP